MHKYIILKVEWEMKKLYGADLIQPLKKGILMD
jgi:hypothetical protein